MTDRGFESVATYLDPDPFSAFGANCVSGLGYRVQLKSLAEYPSLEEYLSAEAVQEGNISGKKSFQHKFARLNCVEDKLDRFA